MPKVPQLVCGRPDLTPSLSESKVQALCTAVHSLSATGLVILCTGELRFTITTILAAGQTAGEWNLNGGPTLQSPGTLHLTSWNTLSSVPSPICHLRILGLREVSHFLKSKMCWVAWNAALFVVTSPVPFLCTVNRPLCYQPFHFTDEAAEARQGEISSPGSQS